MEFVAFQLDELISQNLMAFLFAKVALKLVGSLWLSALHG